MQNGAKMDADKRSWKAGVAPGDLLGTPGTRTAKTIKNWSSRTTPWGPKLGSQIAEK